MKMLIRTSDLVRLYGETDWHEVVGNSIHNGFPLYELSDGRSVRDMMIEAVLQE